MKKYILLLALWFVLPNTIANASSFNFSVTTIPSERQINPEVSYFDLLLKPDETEILKIYLRNDTDTDRVVEVSIQSASTNSNGVVEYGSQLIDTDPTMRYNISDYVNFDKEVTLPKHSTVELPITVWSPKDNFDGLMVGGIRFQEKLDVTTSEGVSGIGIENEFTYEVALLLRQNQNALAADLKLLDVTAGQLNYQNVIQVKLQNPVSIFLNQLSIDAAIYRDDQLLYQTQKTEMQMAPNTHFFFPVDLNGDRLKAGNYELKLKASAQTVDKEKSEWVFTEVFTIQSKEAKKMNQTAVKKKKTLESYVLISIVLNVLVIAILVFILIKRKRKND